MFPQYYIEVIYLANSSLQPHNRALFVAKGLKSYLFSFQSVTTLVNRVGLLEEKLTSLTSNQTLHNEAFDQSTAPQNMSTNVVNLAARLTLLENQVNMLDKASIISQDTDAHA